MAKRRHADSGDRKRAADGHVQVVREDGRREPEGFQVAKEVSPGHARFDIHGEGLGIHAQDPPHRDHRKEDSPVREADVALAMPGAARGNGEPLRAREADRRDDVVGPARLEEKPGRRVEEVAEVRGLRRRHLGAGADRTRDLPLEFFLQCRHTRFTASSRMCLRSRIWP
jgi:hypothetical protein